MRNLKTLLPSKTAMWILLVMVLGLAYNESYLEETIEEMNDISTIEQDESLLILKNPNGNNVQSDSEVANISKLEAIRRQKISEAFLPKYSSNRYLLFSSVGTQCLNIVTNSWLREKAAFDTVLVYYRNISHPTFAALKDIQKNSTNNVLVINHPGYKWVNLRWWLSKVGVETVSQRYKGIWLPDDDVEMDTEDVNKFFLRLDSHPEVLVASPSFSRGSSGWWRRYDRQKKEYILRYTNWVENLSAYIQTKLFYSKWFKKCLKAVNTGFYIDHCFFPATNSSETGIAIIDEVSAFHKPRDENRPSELVETYSGTAKGNNHWEHKNDFTYFDAEEIPSSIYRRRDYKYFGEILKES